MEVVCLDTAQIRHPGDLHERERHLARQLTHTCESAGDACVIGLVGSAHAWIGDGVQLNGGPSMATIVHQAVPELRTIQFESAGGEAWVMTDPNRPAGPTPSPPGPSINSRPAFTSGRPSRTTSTASGSSAPTSPPHHRSSLVVPTRSARRPRSARTTQPQWDRWGAYAGETPLSASRAQVAMAVLPAATTVWRPGPDGRGSRARHLPSSTSVIVATRKPPDLPRPPCSGLNSRPFRSERHLNEPVEPACSGPR